MSAFRQIKEGLEEAVAWSKGEILLRVTFADADGNRVTKLMSRSALDALTQTQPPPDS